jgi:DNA helicase-4
MKCDQCRDGYLIVKLGKKEEKEKKYFLGCTNYKTDNTGCGNIIWKRQYYEMMGYSPDDENENNSSTINAAGYSKKAPPVSRRSPGEKQYYPAIPKKTFKESIQYRGSDLNETSHTVLSALNHISRDFFFGIVVLADVLAGRYSQKIGQHGLNRVPEFGALADMNRADITAIIQFLIDNKFILRTRGQYPVLHPTYEGLHYDTVMTETLLKKLKMLLETEDAGTTYYDR